MISAFHEPWFDEAQAWQIAKCASLREILFEIPHYEGHPPLWHLLLAIPAKLGVPFEIGLKTIGFLISAASAALLLFRSRLPRPLRLALPFTYFFFYQYGIVVRPYGLMLLFLLLLGMELTEWKRYPWKILLILCGLCLTNAYGILFAGGIALCMLWDLVRETSFKRLFTVLWRDKRSVTLLLLLGFAILLLLEIFPANDAFAVHIPSKTSLPVRLFCAFFTFPADCFLTTSNWFSTELISIQLMRIPTAQLILCAALGLVLWSGVVCASTRWSMKYLLIPYALYAIFSATVYFSTHHLGIVFLLFLFWGELTSREGRQRFGKDIVNRVAKTKRDRKLLRSAGVVILASCMVIPLYWTVAASVLEVQNEYCAARSMAGFLKETGLDKEPLLFVKWGYDGSIFQESLGNEDYINTSLITGAVPLNAYYDHNIAFNLNDGKAEDGYVHYRSVSYEECLAVTAEWRSRGIPEVVIGFPDLKDVYGDLVSSKDYTCVYNKDVGMIWKAGTETGTATVYVRNDLLARYGLEPVDDLALRFWNDGIQITDEMREAFENGVPIEEILKPYLDAMFGEED